MRTGTAVLDPYANPKTPYFLLSFILLLSNEFLYNLEGDPVPPKLFLAPAKDGGAPPDADGTGGAAAPSAASPSTLAGGRRMSAGKGGPTAGACRTDKFF